MQEAIVTIIVVCAAIAVLQRYAPRALRRACRAHGVRMATRIGWHGFAAKLSAQAEEGAACGSGCGSCGSCGDPVEKSQTATATVSVDALKRTIQR